MGKLTTARQKMLLTANFSNVLQTKMLAWNQSILHMGQMLKSLSYKNVLQRGYVIARDADNRIISRKADNLKPVKIEFADGILDLD